VVVVGRADGFLVLGYRGDALAVVGGGAVLLFDRLFLDWLLFDRLFLDGLLLGLALQAVDEGGDLLATVVAAGLGTEGG